MRDCELSLGQRHVAATSYLERMAPIGYEASWRYVDERVALPPDHADYLESAADVLDEVRAAHLTIDRAWARLRRLQKLAGRRSPPPWAVTPTSPARWHGDERRGAVVAARTWLRRAAIDDLVAHPDARTALDATRATARSDLVAMPTTTALESALAWARTNIAHGGDHRAYVVHHLLGHAHVFLHGRPTVGTVWSFGPAPPGHESDAPRLVLRDPVGLWRQSPDDGRRALRAAAADLAVLGHGTPALRVLAGEDVEGTENVASVLAAALDEIGLSWLLEVDAEQAALAAQLRRFLLDELSLEDLARWTRLTFPRPTHGETSHFALLDQGVDLLAEPVEREQLVHAVRRAANVFLASSRNLDDDPSMPRIVVRTDADRSTPVRRRWRHRLR